MKLKLQYFGLLMWRTDSLEKTLILGKFMAESEELKIHLMKVKEESEKVVLNFGIQKTNIMGPAPVTSWQIDGDTV